MNKCKRHGIVRDEIYKFDLAIFSDGDIQHAIDWYAKTNSIEAWEVVHIPQRQAQFATYSPLKNGIIWFVTPDIHSSVITHECFHAAMYLFERLELKTIDSNNEEVFAYYLEWLVKKTKDVLQKRLK